MTERSVGLRLEREAPSVEDVWAEAGDMVCFLLGCSFSWENQLAEAGLVPRQIEQGSNVPMYRTNIQNARAGTPNQPQAGPPEPPPLRPQGLSPACCVSGVFGGQLVVSMRPYLESDIPKVQAITAKYPGAHGAPVHWGDPAEIGIADIVRTQRSATHACSAPLALGSHRSRPDRAGLGCVGQSKVDFGDSVPLKEGEVPVFWACGVTPQTALEAAALPVAVTHSPGYMMMCDLMDDELLVDEVRAPAPSANAAW